MHELQRLVLILGLGLVLCVKTCLFGESSTCLTVYEEGGAPAVFRSPKCPRWKLTSKEQSQSAPPPSSTGRCQSAMHQGRRKSQEDRLLCNLDIRIPFPGPGGIKEVTVGIVAVFDGHNGAEASEMASKLLLEYFTLHTYFLLDVAYSVLSRQLVGKLPTRRAGDLALENLKWDEELDQYVINFGRFKLTLSAIFDGSFHLKLLKEALIRAIDDIDTAFSKDARRNKFDSGSTATVILTADGQILVANVGDSKAFLCSEVYQSPVEAKATFLRLYRQKRSDGDLQSARDYRKLKLASSGGWRFLVAKELTRDHHPNRDDEKGRVESAGGYVSEWGGVARVNGQLAISRAIGDVYFKRYGVISVPEVTDWQPLTTNDSYLVVASDGVFEKLSLQDICEILWDLRGDVTGRQELCSAGSYSLADCIVAAAFEKGSRDNMAAVLVPFGSISISQTLWKGECDRSGKFNPAVLGYEQHIDEPSDEKTSELTRSEHGASEIMAKFERLLVEGKDSTYGCFYLSENLDENDDYTFWVQKDDKEFELTRLYALPASKGQNFGGPLNLYIDSSICMPFGMNIDGDKNQCINAEGVARFLGLLGSIPLHNAGSDEHGTSDSRYILKKKFGRGSYGEVWLAFYWNCSQSSKASQWSRKDKNFSFRTLHLGDHDEEEPSFSDGNMFILKRIMVERGHAVYLSGLREKYFGETFLNASTLLGVALSDEMLASFWRSPQPNTDNCMKTNESFSQEYRLNSSVDGMFLGENRFQGIVHEEGLDHIARYVESFESRSSEIWLVFRHEGMSLWKLLYTAEEMVNSADEEDGHVKRVQILHPSKWWHWLKTTEAGKDEMRNLIWQLLMALKSCHDRNITHRDIKPENMVICFEDQNSGRCLQGPPTADRNYTTKMRIIDFGSAVDEYTVKHLYGSAGPSRSEQTHEYTPPEAFLNVSWYKGGPTCTKYDMWSVGVVILELILGTPNVFQINSRTRALLDQHFEGWSDSLKDLAYKLRSFMEMCILIPGISSNLHHTWGTDDLGSIPPVSWKCSEEFFSHQIKSRDPLKIGFPDVWSLRLVRGLLRWNPEDRLSVDDALRHPYFSSSLNRGHVKI